MRDKVLQFCRREGLLPAGTAVVCAVSGGADSVALLHVLLSLQTELNILLTAAHFNHGLRGAESDADESFVIDLCRQWQVPLKTGSGDCAAYGKERGMSTEEAARVLRYEFLRSCPGTVVTAHNADDQVETVLLNLLRGTGLRGLGGIAPKQPGLERPLLAVTRQEIEAYLAAHGLPHREDSSNSRDDALRNRLRHHVIPLLRQENPGLSHTVRRMTGLLRQEEAFLSHQTEALLQTAKRPDGWDCEVLRQAEPVLRRRAIRTLLQIPKPAMIHVEQVEGLLEDLSGSASVCLSGGWIARREYGLLRLEQPQTPERPQPVILRWGETVEIPWANCRVRLEQAAPLQEPVDFVHTFALREELVERELHIRPRRIGDRLRLSGGSKSLKRLMIERKLPAARREHTPVLETGGLLAVCGLDADIRLKAKPGQRAVIIRFFP